MNSFLRFIAVLLIVALAVVLCLYIFDVVSFTDAKDVLQKTLLSLGVIAVSGGIISALFQKNS